MSVASSACDFTRVLHTTPPMGAPNDATHAVTGREVLARTTSVICCTHGNMSRGLARTTAVREKRYMAGLLRGVRSLQLRCFKASRHGM